MHLVAKNSHLHFSTSRLLVSLAIDADNEPLSHSSLEQIMLAIHIAAEINQRWSELEQLPSLDRLHVLESLIARHVLTSGSCCTATYMPNDDLYSDFDSRRIENSEHTWSKSDD